ncbi:MAG: response regulator [Bdellovibrionales bacterium]
MNILYIEDNPTVNSVNRAILTHRCPYADVVVIPATTYLEAVEKLKKNKIDLIICDFEFPGKPDRTGNVPPLSGGIDFYLYLNERNKRVAVKERIPLFFLSGKSRSEIREAFFEIGFIVSDDHIFEKITFLHEIIDAYYDKLCAIGQIATRPSKRKTAESTEAPSAVLKKHQL